MQSIEDATTAVDAEVETESQITNAGEASKFPEADAHHEMAHEQAAEAAGNSVETALALSDVVELDSQPGVTTEACVTEPEKTASDAETDANAHIDASVAVAGDTFEDLTEADAEDKNIESHAAPNSESITQDKNEQDAGNFESDVEKADHKDVASHDEDITDTTQSTELQSADEKSASSPADVIESELNVQNDPAVNGKESSLDAEIGLKELDNNDENNNNVETTEVHESIDISISETSKVDDEDIVSERNGELASEQKNMDDVQEEATNESYIDVVTVESEGLWLSALLKLNDNNGYISNFIYFNPSQKRT